MKSKRIFPVPPLLIVGAVVLFVNLIALDYVVIKMVTAGSGVLGETTTAACPQSCLAAINQLSGGTGTGTAAREFSIELGGGSNATDDWTDVPGAQAYVNTGWYRSIKSVTFEAVVGVPTGNQVAYVRLFNVTDQHPVWFSELSMTGTGPTRLAATITLDRGNKLYQVQMKTQLKYTANLTQARLRITTY